MCHFAWFGLWRVEFQWMKEGSVRPDPDKRVGSYKVPKVGR